MNRDELLRDQLKHAHGVNALVDNHRFKVVQFVLAFHGVVLTALTLNPQLQSMSLSAGLAIWLGAGLGAVGLSLFATFFSLHMYMRSFKKWIAALESHLHSFYVDEQMAQHKGTLSWDDNSPVVPAERTLVVLLGLFVLLNVGVPSLAATLMNAPVDHVYGLAASIFAAHLLVFVWLFTSKHKGLKFHRPQSGAHATHYKGNAAEDSNERGWFVGAFKAGPLNSRTIEIKWGLHKAGESRKAWAPGGGSHTISVLIEGHVVEEFKDQEYKLSTPGDFVIFPPGVPHKWRAEADSTVLTVRWVDT